MGEEGHSIVVGSIVGIIWKVFAIFNKYVVVST
jgi:hypothetical protein